MSFPAEANLKPYFGEMNFAERFVLYNDMSYNIIETLYNRIYWDI